MLWEVIALIVVSELEGQEVSFAVMGSSLFQIVPPLSPTSHSEGPWVRVIKVEPIHSPGPGKVNIMARPMSLLVPLCTDHSLFLTCTSPQDPFSPPFSEADPSGLHLLGPFANWPLTGSNQRKHFQRVEEKEAGYLSQLLLASEQFCGSRSMLLLLQFLPGDPFSTGPALIGLWLLFLPLSLGPLNSRR